MSVVDVSASGELSWQHDDLFQKRQEVARRAVRHQDTGTPLGYSPGRSDRQASYTQQASPVQLIGCVCSV